MEGWVFFLTFVFCAFILTLPLVFLGLCIKKSAWWLKYLFLTLTFGVCAGMSGFLTIVLGYYGIGDSLLSAVNGFYWVNLMVFLLVLTLFVIKIVVYVLEQLKLSAEVKREEDEQVYEID